MAMTVTDYSGLGPAMGKLGDIFTGMQTDAAKADLMRHQRDQYVADTALLNQKFGNLAKDRATIDARNAFYASHPDFSDPAVLAKQFSMSTMDPTSGAGSNIDPVDAWRIANDIQYPSDPGASPEQYSRGALSSGLAWGSTPYGAQLNDDAAMQRQQYASNAAQEGDVLRYLLTPQKPPKLYNVNAKTTAKIPEIVKGALATQYPGVNVDPQTEAEIEQQVAREMGYTNNVGSAVGNVLDRMKEALSTTPGKPGGLFGWGSTSPGLKFDPTQEEPAPYDQPTAIDTQKVKDLFRSIFGHDPEAMGINVDALTGAAPDMVTGNPGQMLTPEMLSGASGDGGAGTGGPAPGPAPAPQANMPPAEGGAKPSTPQRAPAKVSTGSDGNVSVQSDGMSAGPQEGDTVQGVAGNVVLVFRNGAWENP
jgi:hypothetical protein